MSQQSLNERERREQIDMPHPNPTCLHPILYLFRRHRTKRVLARGKGYGAPPLVAPFFDRVAVGLLRRQQCRHTCFAAATAAAAATAVATAVATAAAILGDCRFEAASDQWDIKYDLDTSELFEHGLERKGGGKEGRKYG